MYLEVKKNIILLTDFGLKDTYVGTMKCVIKEINSNVAIVDLSHNIAPYNIKQAIFSVITNLNYFPKSSILLVVVDPGVGSSRRCLLCDIDGLLIIGPDNGIFSPFIDKSQFFEITYDSANTGNTFDGRDLFSPVAAKFSLGGDIQKFVSPVKPLSVKKIEYLSVCKGKLIKASFFSEDHFGNLITNIENKFYNYLADLEVIEGKKSYRLVKRAKTFSDLKDGEVAFITGSHGFIEIISNKKAVRDVLGLTLNFDQIRLKGALNG